MYIKTKLERIFMVERYAREEMKKLDAFDWLILASIVWAMLMVVVKSI